MANPFPDLFADVNDVDASSAQRRFGFRSFPAGEVVLAAGAPGRALAGVIEGVLEVRAGDVAVATVGPGELVGELALFESVQRTADVVARTDSEILVVERDAYEELRDTAHPVAANLERLVLRQQVQRLREMDDRIAWMSEGERRAARFPGADFFSRIAAEFGRGGMFDPVGIDPVRALLASRLFPDISDAVLEALADRLEVQACGSGEFLVTEGRPADRLWLVESGEVEVLVATGEDEVQPLARVGPGALIGAAALVDGGVRMASCVARERVVALTLDVEAWTRLESDPTLVGSALRRAVIRALAAQLAGANALVARFERERAAETLAEARSRLVASVTPRAEPS